MIVLHHHEVVNVFVRFIFLSYTGINYIFPKTFTKLNGDPGHI
jgi:hypothetical protein